MDWVALAQAGPVAILLVIGSALAVALVKKVLVPGWIYDQERAAHVETQKREQAGLKREAILATALSKLTKVVVNGNGAKRA